MNNVKISIIMPVYNAQDTIGRAITSILSQTIADWELLIINDGSTDRTKEIIEAYKDPRIILYSQNNEGASSARNKGIDISKGEFITFMDADDVIHAEYLSLLLSASQKNDADISMCSYIKMSTDEFQSKKENNILSVDSSSYRKFSREDCLAKMFYKNMVMPYPFLKLFKREVIGDTRFTDRLKLGEDLDFNFQVMQKANRIIFLENKLYYHINTAGSITHTLNYDVIHTHFNDLIEKKKVSSPAVTKAINSRLFVLAYDTLSQIDNLHDTQSYAQEYIDFISKNRSGVLKDSSTSLIVKLLGIMSIISIPLTVSTCRACKKIELKKAI